jgi:hypothetical protein
MSDVRCLQWLAARAVPAMRGGKPGDSVP